MEISGLRLRNIVGLGLRVAIDGGLRLRWRSSWRGVASYCRANLRTPNRLNRRRCARSHCSAADSRHDP